MAGMRAQDLFPVGGGTHPRRLAGRGVTGNAWGRAIDRSARQSERDRERKPERVDALRASLTTISETGGYPVDEKPMTPEEFAAAMQGVRDRLDEGGVA